MRPKWRRALRILLMLVGLALVAVVVAVATMDRWLLVRSATS